MIGVVEFRSTSALMHQVLLVTSLRCFLGC